MKIKLILASVASLALLASCGDGIDWSDPKNPLCTSGHYEADYDNKKVKDGTERKRVNGKYKTVTKYKTVRVYDGQDWICDVKQES